MHLGWLGLCLCLCRLGHRRHPRLRRSVHHLAAVDHLVSTWRKQGLVQAKAGGQRGERDGVKKVGVDRVLFFETRLFSSVTLDVILACKYRRRQIRAPMFARLPQPNRELPPIMSSVSMEFGAAANHALGFLVARWDIQPVRGVQAGLSWSLPA